MLPIAISFSSLGISRKSRSDQTTAVTVIAFAIQRFSRTIFHASVTKTATIGVTTTVAGSHGDSCLTPIITDPSTVIAATCSDNSRSSELQVACSDSMKVLLFLLLVPARTPRRCTQYFVPCTEYLVSGVPPFVSPSCSSSPSHVARHAFFPSQPRLPPRSKIDRRFRHSN